MDKKGISARLAEDFSKINELSAKDKEALRLLVIDYFAASFAGYEQNKQLNSPVERIIFAEGGCEEATVFGCERRLSARKAAYMNALYAHGADMDDGCKKAMGHVGVHVISAVFALAEKLNASYDEVLTALAVGYEAYIRISSAAQPGLVQRGYHSTGMAGTLACAVACAKLYGLDACGIENALALSTTISGGLLSYGDSRPGIKPLNPAHAAENGVYAAMLAANGVEGPCEALEGQNGWFHAVTDRVNEKMLEGSADGHLLLHDCYFKLYPSCRHTHCGIEAAIELHSKVETEKIEAVDVFLYPNAIKLAGQMKYPKDKDDTKFSVHYTLARALVNGRYGIADMNPPDLSSETLTLIDKINLIPAPEMEDAENGIRGAMVSVRLKSGNREDCTVFVPKGDPEKPLAKSDIVEKLKVCALWQCDENLPDRLVAHIDSMEGKAVFVSPAVLLTGIKKYQTADRK